MIIKAIIKAQRYSTRHLLQAFSVKDTAQFYYTLRAKKLDKFEELLLLSSLIELNQIKHFCSK